MHMNVIGTMLKGFFQQGATPTRIISMAWQQSVG